MTRLRAALFTMASIVALSSSSMEGNSFTGKDCLEEKKLVDVKGINLTALGGKAIKIITSDDEHTYILTDGDANELRDLNFEVKNGVLFLTVKEKVTGFIRDPKKTKKYNNTTTTTIFHGPFTELDVSSQDTCRLTISGKNIQRSKINQLRLDFQNQKLMQEFLGGRSKKGPLPFEELAKQIPDDVTGSGPITFDGVKMLCDVVQGKLIAAKIIKGALVFGNETYSKGSAFADGKWLLSDEVTNSGFTLTVKMPAVNSINLITSVESLEIEKPQGSVTLDLQDACNATIRNPSGEFRAKLSENSKLIIDRFVGKENAFLTLSNSSYVSVGNGASLKKLDLTISGHAKALFYELEKAKIVACNKAKVQLFGKDPISVLWIKELDKSSVEVKQPTLLDDI